jgi:hypothetical protein
VALDRRNRAVRIRHSLALCQLADETLTVLREAYDGRGYAAAFRIRDDGRLATFHNGYDGVRRTEIDTYYFRHFLYPPKKL